MLLSLLPGLLWVLLLDLLWVGRLLAVDLELLQWDLSQYLLWVLLLDLRWVDPVDLLLRWVGRLLLAVVMVLLLWVDLLLDMEPLRCNNNRSILLLHR